jgi:hypothetical protein
LRSFHDQRPKITWQAVPNATGYQVWIGNRSSGQLPLISTTVSTLEYQPTSNLGIGRIEAYVRANFPGQSFGSWSLINRFTVVTRPAPQPLTPLSSTFNRQQTFTWSAVTGASSYGFYLKNTNTNTVVADVMGLSTTSWTPTSPLPEGNYAWWSFAEMPFSSLRSNWSSRIDFHIGGRPVIAGPSGRVGLLRPVLSWNGVVGAATYDVWMNQVGSGGSQSVLFSVRGVTGTTFQVPESLVGGATYRYWVRAVSTADQCSPWSLPAGPEKPNDNPTAARIPAVVNRSSSAENDRSSAAASPITGAAADAVIADLVQWLFTGDTKELC